ncbi:hypothetical protein [Candidatus Arsenophonus triatominarum]|uniref:hypothetical protein n=1 Tax=Candidatus Arsenophonus triatominarum TaxID=57911 RepID=UPI0013969032|nr:hypothetical protein [Candidatus Arsenophonus triatominarum]
MEKQEDFWDIKDTELCFVYANKSAFTTSRLPVNFNIEGKRTFECPVSWSECANISDTYEQIVLTSGKPIFFIVTHIAGKEGILQSFFVKKKPYYNQSKIVGTICHGRKISPILLPKYFFKQPTAPSILINYPPNNLFTTEELNVLFFAMKLMSNQEIALRLGTYSCVVEQIIRQIYKKTDIYSRKQLRDYGIAEGFDNYFPPCLLKGLL